MMTLFNILCAVHHGIYTLCNCLSSKMHTLFNCRKTSLVDFNKYLQEQVNAPLLPPGEHVRRRPGLLMKKMNARCHQLYANSIVVEFLFNDDTVTRIRNGLVPKKCCSAPGTNVWQLDVNTTSGTSISLNSPPTSSSTSCSLVASSRSSTQYCIVPQHNTNNIRSSSNRIQCTVHQTSAA